MSNERKQKSYSNEEKCLSLSTIKALKGISGIQSRFRTDKRSKNRLKQNGTMSKVRRRKSKRNEAKKIRKCIVQSFIR